ncbi:putative HVA22-like protein g [Drosophila elegans]|uniref:putative HVA22-like protein g n=1 Tax=Drosophila elegans TaxID=30023 RepID=UPI0007E6CB9E|nr:putative HVA22-like protein g [Drosophila elegans]
MHIEMCLFSCLSRLLFFVYGTLGPAWHTYKTLNNGDTMFLAWAKYWIVYAFLVTFEVLADTFLSWLPLYMPTKFLLILWIVLSAPAANVWIFDAVLSPVLARRQEQIDHFLHRGQDKLLGDIFVWMTQLWFRSQTYALPFVTHLWSRSSTDKSGDLVEATGVGASEDPDSAPASVRTSAQHLSSYSSPVGSLLGVNGDDFEETQLGVTRATTDLHSAHSLNDLVEKNIKLLESSGILNHRVKRKSKIFKPSNEELATKFNRNDQKEELYDDVEDLLANSMIGTTDKEVGQRQSINHLLYQKNP